MHFVTIKAQIFYPDNITKNRKWKFNNKNFFEGIFVNLLNNLGPIQILIVYENSVVDFN